MIMIAFERFCGTRIIVFIIEKNINKRNRPKVLIQTALRALSRVIHGKHTKNSIDFLPAMDYNKINSSKGEDMMKKILLALLTALMLFAFSACGSTDDQTGTDSNGGTEENIASESDLSVDEDEPRYTSDGDLIVEEERPASDSDLTEDSETEQ